MFGSLGPARNSCSRVENEATSFAEDYCKIALFHPEFIFSANNFSFLHTVKRL